MIRKPVINEGFVANQELVFLRRYKFGQRTLLLFGISVLVRDEVRKGLDLEKYELEGIFVLKSVDPVNLFGGIIGSFFLHSKILDDVTTIL